MEHATTRATSTEPRAGRVAGALALALGMVLARGLAAAPAAPPRAPIPVDVGTYRVYQKDRFIGTEQFRFEKRRDSLLVHSVLRQLLPRPKGAVDTLRKEATLVLAAADGDLRGYSSTEYVNRRQLTRGLTMADTAYTSYRQSADGGVGDTYARPPGRIYIIDPQVFVAFDVISRDMHRQSFDERPITLLYLAGRDSAVEARVRRLGKESIHLGTHTYTTEKFRITDPWSEFFAWVSNSGRMLRLTLPAVGLRVDRDPATLTSSSAPPPPSR